MRIGQAIWALEKLGIPTASLGEFKTDSITVVIPQKRKRETVKERMRDIRYCDLHSLKDMYMPVAKRQRRLDDTIPLLPIASDECVYRCLNMDDSDKMATRPELPSRPIFDMQSLPSEWTDLGPEDAKAHILGGGSCLISGPAGSGKSYMVKSIVDELRKSKPVALISKTHVAAQNMSIVETEGSAGLPGMTSDAWTRRHVMH